MSFPPEEATFRIVLLATMPEPTHSSASVLLISITPPSA
jgi:hypothetical protein